MRDPVEFSEARSEEALETGNLRFSDVVLHSTDWTTETVVSQLKRGNIVLNPRFQRRDAWDRERKSQFIESLILGLPIPQIVLAESKDRRGTFIVLDGKQRLLSLLQFWGMGDGPNNRYALTGLDARTNLLRKTFSDLESDSSLAEDFNALLNQPIRTVVIKNWPDIAFLHLVFLRLNTGSVKLSPQELRQAMFPGPFTDFVDDRAMRSVGLQELLGIEEPDYRMRDVELLARYLAFHFFLDEYRGRMKSFLDHTFDRLNAAWDAKAGNAEEALNSFEMALETLMIVFPDGVARKPESRQLNRAILDALVFYATDAQVREAMKKQGEAIRSAYTKLFKDHEFTASVERDTASVANTAVRLQKWGNVLRSVTGLDLRVPTATSDRISFGGLWT